MTIQENRQAYATDTMAEQDGTTVDDRLEREAQRFAILPRCIHGIAKGLYCKDCQE